MRETVMTASSRLDALVRAYRPLQLRGLLVEGRHVLPPPSPRPPPARRVALLALVLAVAGRRPS